jgi:hypothetical protein
MVIFRIFLSKVLGPSVARIFFAWKISFRLFWIQKVQIVVGLDVITLKIRNSSFWKFFEKYIEKMLLYYKLLSVSLWKYIWQTMTICTCLIKKSLTISFIFLIIICPRKDPGQTWPQNFGQKIQKMIISKANPRLVKIVTDQRSKIKYLQYLDLYLLENFKNLVINGFRESKIFHWKKAS